MTRPSCNTHPTTMQPQSRLLPTAVRAQQVTSLVAALMAAGLVAACGGGGGGGSDGGASTASSGNVSQAEAQTAVTPTTTSTDPEATGYMGSTGSAPGSAEALADTPTGTGTDPLAAQGSSTPTDTGEQAQSSTPSTPADSPTAMATAQAVQVSATPTVDPGPYWSQPSGQLVAGFDMAGTDAVSKWTFYNGAEYPGATGSLSETTGVSGKGGKLTYNFSCGGTYWTALAGRKCGKYVAMTLPKVPTTLSFGSTDVPTIAFDVRNLQGTATPTLRVVDNTGQTLQFKGLTARSLENANGANWQRVQMPIAKSSSFWGGANDGVLHLPIKQTAVLAGDVPLPTPPGDLEIDNVTYLPTPDTVFDLKANAPLSGITYPSSYLGRVGVVWRLRYGYPALDKAVAAGLTLVRMDLQWEAVEINGKWDFTYYSNIANELAKRNVKILWILDYGHKDHGGTGTAPLTTANQAAYAEFARRAAATFKGRNVIGFEIWNEPNWQPFWPNPDPAAYARLLGVTVDAMRTADPAVKITTGGVADTDFDYVMNVLRSGKASKVNAIGLHPYRKSGPETFAAQLPTFKGMMQAVGLNAEIWDTEWGYSAYRDIGDVATYGNGLDARAMRRQAVLTVRKALTQIAINTPVSILYDLVNDGTDPLNREHNFGLLKADLSDKPAMVAMRSLYAAQNGRTLKGLLPNVPPGLHVIRWDGATNKSFAIWSDAPSGSRVKLTLPTTATSIKMWDGSNPSTLTAGKQMYLQESDGPVFVTVPN